MQNIDKYLRKMKAPKDKRPEAYRQGVLQIHITQACNLACTHCTQGSNLVKKPSFMSPDHFQEACRSLKDYFGVVGVFGGDPCLSAGTKVFTTNGIFPIEDLQDKQFFVRNLNGEISPAFCRLSGKNKILYRIKLRGGHEYLATAEHEWPAMTMLVPRSHNKPRTMTAPVKLKTTELVAGMRLPIIRTDSLWYGFEGNRDEGFFAGWLYGDGWIFRKSDSEKIKSKSSRIGFVVNIDDYNSVIASKLISQLRALGSPSKFSKLPRKSCYTATAGSPEVKAWLEKYGLTAKEEGLPLSIWSTASEEFRIGFLDGLFSSDGHVEISKKRSFARIRLTTSREKIAKDVSDLLGFYGIKTAVRSRTRSGNEFPGGKIYDRSYTSYEVSIEGSADVEHFGKLIRLTHQVKRERIESVKGKHKFDVENSNIEIISIEKTELKQDVWDISVGDDTHCFQLAHCVTGNCISPYFAEYCKIMQKEIPFERRGLWANNLFGHGKICRETFNPSVCNLNVHMDQKALAEFRRDWPEAMIVGADSDSRHSPPFVAMQDVIENEQERWELIANCDVNQYWSALIGVFRGELRGYFCELAGAQAMLHEHEPDYPDLGMRIRPGWWNQPMQAFVEQVKYHCHACGIPLKGAGDLALTGVVEQVSKTHQGIYNLKIKTKEVQLVTLRSELKATVARATNYIQNSQENIPSLEKRSTEEGIALTKEQKDRFERGLNRKVIETSVAHKALLIFEDFPKDSSEKTNYDDYWLTPPLKSLPERLILGNANYEKHVTDEGWQLQHGLVDAGWDIAGHSYPIDELDVKKILGATNPEIVFVQDARDWDIESPGCFDKNVCFINVEALKPSKAFKLVVVKDAGTVVEYQKKFAEKIGAHAAIIYYHPESVLAQSPWLKDYGLIRTYHSLDSKVCEKIDLTARRQRGLVSGALGPAYPFRKRVMDNAGRLNIATLHHPGYGATGSVVTRYLETLAKYKVHVATASKFGFALRKIIESVAMGCTPITDLPKYDVLPEIDEALVRVSPDINHVELRAVINHSINNWNQEKAIHFAEKARAFYDYRVVGKRLDEAIRFANQTFKKMGV